MPGRFFKVMPIDEGGWVRLQFTCLLCGFVLKGNASEGLDEKMRGHLVESHPEELAAIESK